METIFYTGAMVTGFMISQTYNYFFGNSNANANTNTGNGPVHTNINIHTHTHKNPQIESKSQDENINIPIPKSLLYDIVLFQNNQLKPVENNNIKFKHHGDHNEQLTFEDELKQKMLMLREKTKPILEVD